MNTDSFRVFSTLCSIRVHLRNAWPKICFSLLLLALAPALSAQAAEGDPQPIPPLKAHVTDLTGTLDAQQQQQLESDLTALEKSKGSQLGVLIVPTTQPEDIAQFGIRVGDAWKLGRKGTDDGAILIVAKNDRRVRIEVGRGLEGAIPDAAAARIIREYVTPKFRSGDYYGGIHDATDVLGKLIQGEPLPPPLTDERDSGGSDPFNAVIFAVFAILFARSLFGGLSAPPRAGLTGIVGAGAAWLLSGVVPLAVGLGVVGLVLGLLGGGGGGFANRGGWGGFPGGGGGFGGGGFGGGGGGGFSGGGGSFGGGGASGSW